MLEWKTSSEHEKNFFPPQFLKKLVTTTKELFFRCMISMLSDITRLHYQILSDNIVAFEPFASIIVLNVQGRPKAVKAGSIIVSVRFSKQIRHFELFCGTNHFQLWSPYLQNPNLWLQSTSVQSLGNSCFEDLGKWPWDQQR